MIGLLNLLVAGGFAIGNSIKESVENEEQRKNKKIENQKRIQNGKIDEDWYVAEHAQLRRISTNEKVIITDVPMDNVENMSNYRLGDRIMYTNNWKYIRNLSAEQRELDFQIVKKNSNGRRIVKLYDTGYYEFYENGRSYKQKIRMGQEFVDIQTGEKYYLRKFDIPYGKEEKYKLRQTVHVEFYMNLKGMLTQLSYESNKKIYTKEQKEAILDFEKKVNEAQKNGGWSEQCHTTEYKSIFYEHYFFTYNIGYESDNVDYSNEFMKDL